MNPVYQFDDGWVHVFQDAEDAPFKTEEEAWEDYRRELKNRVACRTGGCDE